MTQLEIQTSQAESLPSMKNLALTLVENQHVTEMHPHVPFQWVQGSSQSKLHGEVHVSISTPTKWEFISIGSLNTKLLHK